MTPEENLLLRQELNSLVFARDEAYAKHISLSNQIKKVRARLGEKITKIKPDPLCECAKMGEKINPRCTRADACMARSGV